MIRSAGVVGSFTLLSRGLGMLRDIIIAYYFGTSLVASAFFVAFTLPNLFRRLFGEGALSAAFVPVFIETRTKQGDRAAWEMASKVVTMTAALLSAIALIGVLLFWVLGNLPCLFAERWITTFELSRIMFPYVVFICLAALFMAVLNSFKHFATSAFAPCLLNIILIVVMLAVFPMVGNEPDIRATVLAWGVVLAGIAQVLFQLPALKRFGCPFKFSNRWNDPAIRRILVLMGPAALGMAVTQFNVLADRLLALWIGDWAPAALFYSERWVYLPLGVIATAFSTVLLPTYSQQVADDKHHMLGDTLSDALRHISFIMVPSTIGLMVLAPQILTTIMEWGGAFDAESTRLTARALYFYAPGLIVFSVSKVIVPAYYAQQDTRTPVRIGFITIALNLILNITFILTLPEYWKHAGMALSTVIAGAMNALILAQILKTRGIHIQWKQIIRSFMRYLLIALVMGAGVWAIARFAAPLLSEILPAKLAQVANLGLAVLGGALIYFLLSFATRSRELRETMKAIPGK